MKKQEIKRDVIRDKIIGFLNYISENTKVVWITVGAVVVIIFIATFFSNKNQDRLLDSNLSISLIQQRAMNNDDNSDSLLLQDYKNILAAPISEHDYNQAFIYLLSNAIENNNNEYTISLLSDNNFSSKDDMLNSYLYLTKAIYLYSEDINNYVKFYEKAIKLVPSYDLKVIWSSDLIDFYINRNNYTEANNVLGTLKDLVGDTDNLSSTAKNDLDFIESKVKQLN
tara:strand:+ start:439 stop:1116 length:678 start_codon:yes stop_codon:yes gene_type:complete